MARARSIRQRNSPRTASRPRSSSRRLVILAPSRPQSPLPASAARRSRSDSPRRMRAHRSLRSGSPERPGPSWAPTWDRQSRLAIFPSTRSSGAMGSCPSRSSSRDASGCRRSMTRSTSSPTGRPCDRSSSSTSRPTAAGPRTGRAPKLTCGRQPSRSTTTSPLSTCRSPRASSLASPRASGLASGTTLHAALQHLRNPRDSNPGAARASPRADLWSSTLTLDDHKSTFDVQVTPHLEPRASGTTLHAALQHLRNPRDSNPGAARASPRADLWSSTLAIDDHKSTFDVQVTPHLEPRASGTTLHAALQHPRNPRDSNPGAARASPRADLWSSTLAIDDHKSTFDLQVTPRLESRASSLEPRASSSTLHAALQHLRNPRDSNPGAARGEPQS
ncbi:exported hypothetical protein [Pseudoclavibacter sp. 8L]|nr:exported hypothetical protein [Pseudoclavibacter sp. 8L]